MSGAWGIELWDQFDNIAIHTQKGIDFCERFAQFIKERCIIENEYAAKLKKLTKSFQPKRKEEDREFSYTKGFVGLISEIYDIAGQHEVIAENLTTVILQGIQLYVQQVKQDRKKHLQDGAKQFNNLQTQLQQLDKAKRQYEKSFRESEKAQELYRKADADIHMSRADVEKSKNSMVQRQQICEESKNEYAAELQKTNDSQREHYNVLMPQVMQGLQDMEEKRVKKVQELLKGCSDVERDILPIVNACIDGMVKSSDLVSDVEDSKLVVEKYKSGFVPPGDIPFEDLSCSSGPCENHSPSVSLRQSVRVDSMRGGGGTKVKRRTGIFGIFGSSKTDDTKEDYSHLPPNQQKKKLIQRIDSIKTTLAKETAERDGMLKMQDVYKQNQALGDPQSLSKQLEENAQKLDKLRLELQKFEGYLADMDRPGRTQGDAALSANRSSISLTTSLHESQPTTPTAIANRGSYPDVARINHGTDESSPFGGIREEGGGEGGRGGEGVVVVGGGVVVGGITRLDSFEDIEEDSTVIGTCVALYAFDAPSEGSISMGEGEEFNIVERDQGDGWLRVRRCNGEEGFVPTSYVECHFHSS